MDNSGLSDKKSEDSYIKTGSSKEKKVATLKGKKGKYKLVFSAGKKYSKKKTKTRYGKLKNGAKDSYAVYLLWEEDAEGDFVEKTIRVHDGNGEEPLYTLKTGTYRTGDGHEP